MLSLSPRVLYASIFFILVMVLIFIVKPKPLFDENGNIHSFGLTSNDSTVMSLGVITVAVAVTSMAVFSMIDVVFSVPQGRF